MALSLDQIQQALKNPKAKAQLAKAVKHEHRLRFHAEEVEDSVDASPYQTDFLKWVASLLPADKAAMFQRVLQYPVYTNEILKAISEEYQKVYEAENSSFTYEFSSENQKDEFLDYLISIDFWERWKNESSDAMMRNINSILVVDMPSETNGETEPYYYFLPIDDIKDIAVDDEGNILWFISALPYENIKDRTYFVLDDTSYRKIDKDGKTIIEAPHGLRYTPACFFWAEPMKKDKPIVKRSPITPALNNLNWLLFWETARRCNEISAAFPVMVTYKEKCDFEATVEGVSYHCQNGVIDYGNGRTGACPACAQNKFLGPGTLLKVPMPKPREGSTSYPNTIEAVKVIDASPDSLKYCTERSTELWDEIFYDCVGNDSTVVDKQAINQDQVKAHFSSQENILYNLKDNLQKSHKFVVETIARLKYESSFVSCSINYGTDFYLQTTEEAINEYTKAKTAGAPQYFLNYKRGKIDSIATRGNDNDTERLMILKNLEPWIDLSLNEAKHLGLDLTNREGFLLKADFSRLILRFENEYGSITNFGSMIDFSTKINKINLILLQYVNIEYGESIKQAKQLQEQQAAQAGNQSGQQSNR